MVNINMKVDVITLHAVQNYGSVLQALATQEILKQHGCEVEIINYIREDVKYENLLKVRSNGNVIKKAVLYPSVKRWKKVFESFYHEHLNLSEHIYTTKDDFNRYPLHADVFCTGSDQVWNSKWNLGIVPELYLSFAPKNSFKFAFSASFGQNRLEDSEVKATQKYIDDYHFISVREKSAVKILEEQYGVKDAVHILDPTLTMNDSFWRHHAAKRKIAGDYILIYNLNRSREFDDYAKKLSKKTGLPLVRLCIRYDQFYRVGKSVLIPEIPEFISLIDNAKYVLTDSFHATAFSMNMGTEPICVYPKEFGGRLESFLNLVESQQRHVKNYDDLDVVNRNVDFTTVNRILEAERKKANEFLDAVLNSAQIYCAEGVQS